MDKIKTKPEFRLYSKIGTIEFFLIFLFLSIGLLIFWTSIHILFTIIFFNSGSLNFADVIKFMFLSSLFFLVAFLLYMAFFQPLKFYDNYIKPSLSLLPDSNKEIFYNSIENYSIEKRKILLKITMRDFNLYFSYFCLFENKKFEEKMIENGIQKQDYNTLDNELEIFNNMFLNINKDNSLKLYVAPKNIYVQLFQKNPQIITDKSNSVTNTLNNGINFYGITENFFYYQYSKNNKYSAINRYNIIYFDDLNFYCFKETLSKKYWLSFTYKKFGRANKVLLANLLIDGQDMEYFKNIFEKNNVEYNENI